MSPGLSPIRVLTVDDHPLVREGIAGLIGVQTERGRHVTEDTIKRGIIELCVPAC